jgi:acetyl esterase/lipase
MINSWGRRTRGYWKNGGLKMLSRGLVLLGLAALTLLLSALSLDAAPTTPGVKPGSLSTDIEYGKAGGESLLLDVYVPQGAGPFPVAILVHGGGWGSGDKENDIGPMAEPLTEANFTWFSINYRLAPKDRWPACLEDVQTAIRWVKAHAAEYKGDPARVALVGYSAGGQLVCQAAVLANQETQVQAVVGFAPPTDLVTDTRRRGGLSKALQDLLDRQQTPDDSNWTLLRELSPINHIRRGLPPFLLIHGTEDKSAPYEQSLNFQKRLRESGVPCDLITVQGAPHAIGEWDKFDSTYKRKMVAWLEQTLTPAPPQ